MSLSTRPLHAILRLCLYCLILLARVYGQDTSKHGGDKPLKGHLQAFGESGSRLEVDVVDKFPPPEKFFNEYVKQSRPLKLLGAARDTRAFRLWTDDYLLSLKLPEGEGSHINLETMKKENRTQETLLMNFHEFLKVYNNTEYYMVDDIPQFLRGDVFVPCSLQCPRLLEEKMALAMMWFSSGGTKSVVHTDGFDNINCVFRGEKTFIMVDPAVHREKVDLNNEGSHSDIDVDRVDLTKYPKLAKVEFYHINLTAGDCLFIPYRWIHQVRSYNSNVAVNFWWNHYASLELLQEGLTCLDTCDNQLTLKDVSLHGTDTTLEHEGVRDWLVNMVISYEVLSQQQFVEVFLRDMGDTKDLQPEKIEPVMAIVLQMFEHVDVDKDGIFTLQEARQTSDEVWKEISSDMGVVTSMLGGLFIEEENGDIYQEVKDEL